MACFIDWLSDLVDSDKNYKCGDVFLRPCDKSFIFICTHCDKDFKDVEHFMTHLQEELERNQEGLCRAVGEIEDTLEPIEAMFIEEYEESESDLSEKEKYKKTETENIDTQHFRAAIADDVSEVSDYEDLQTEIQETIVEFLSGKEDLDESEITENSGQHEDNPVKSSKHVFKGHNVHQHKKHIQEKIYPCDMCETKCTRKSNLKRHRERHIQEKSHVCDLCTFGFKSARELEVHKRRHTGERPYVCEECGRGYTTSGQLLQHRQRRHQSERNYVCNWCNKAFVANYKLNRHIFLVHGDAPRDKKCTVCDATFKTATSLKVHKLIHEEKTYMCVVCGRAFAQRPGLTSHMKTHNILPQSNSNCIK